MSSTPSWCDPVHMYDRSDCARAITTNPYIDPDFIWMINLGPSLAAQLTGILQHKGEAALAQKFPELALLVTHVVAYVGEYKARYEQEVARKKVTIGNRKAGRNKNRRVGDPLSARVDPAPEDPPVASAPV
ncbi:hypothetical protein B0H14DRAFT_3473535 [Mycena olivaceomarginata]|nr:hypothetical protein B0H14DRAFT_3473535 [Mycena olivaceomarginata]